MDSLRNDNGREVYHFVDEDTLKLGLWYCNRLLGEQRCTGAGELFDTEGGQLRTPDCEAPNCQP